MWSLSLKRTTRSIITSAHFLGRMVSLSPGQLIRPPMILIIGTKPGWRALVIQDIGYCLFTARMDLPRLSTSPLAPMPRSARMYSPLTNVADREKAPRAALRKLRASAPSPYAALGATAPSAGRGRVLQIHFAGRASFPFALEHERPPIKRRLPLWLLPHL